MFFKVIKQIFKYFEPLWLGADGKISIRSSLAIYFSYKFIENLDYGIQKWGADRSLVGLDSNLLILAGLIAALLSLTTYQNIMSKKMDTEASLPPTTTVLVEKAETVTSGPTNGNTRQTDSTIKTTESSEQSGSGTPNIDKKTEG